MLMITVHPNFLVDILQGDLQNLPVRYVGYYFTM